MLSLGQEISSFGHSPLPYPYPGGTNVFFGILDDLSSPHAQYIDSVRVIECTGSDSQAHRDNDSGAYRLADVELDVQAYQLRSADGNLDSSQGNSEKTDDGDAPQARTIPLPNRELDGVWESYVCPFYRWVAIRTKVYF